MKRINLTPIIVLSLLAGCRPSMDSALEQQETERIASKVSIIVDGTISFESRLPEVQKIVTSFVAQNAVIGESEIFIYRLDRQPKLVARIKASEFMTSQQSALVRSIGEPTELTGTDLVTAIEMASDKLMSPSATTSDQNFLLIFTDGFVDPAKEAGQTREFRSMSDFEWPRLKGLTTRFFFLDYEPYQAITAASRNRGLDIACFEDGESFTAKDLRLLVEGVR